MPNVFDQFDVQAPNVFDQFDEPQGGGMSDLIEEARRDPSKNKTYTIPAPVPDEADELRSVTRPGGAAARQANPNEEYRPLGGALGVVPLAEDSQGGVHLSVPGIILEPYRAFKRGLSLEETRGRHFDMTSREMDVADLARPGLQSSDAAMASAGAVSSTNIPTVASLGQRAIVSPRTQALQAAERQGVDVPRAAATDSYAVRAIAGGVKEVPVVGAPIVNASNKALEQIEQRVKQTADELGSGSTLTAGEALRDDATNWIKVVSKDEAEDIYAPVEALVNENFKNPLKVTRRVVGEIEGEAAASKLPPPAIVGKLRKAVEDKAGLTYRGLQNLRTQVGDMLSGNIAPEPGMSKRALEAIYGALSDDLRWLVSKAGGEKAVAAWDSANTAFRETIAARRDALTKIIGNKGDHSPEGIVERLIQMASVKKGADYRRLLMARTTVGDKAWDELGSAIISRMGQTKDGFSVAHFRTAYNNLSKEGKEALFKPEHRVALNDLSLIGGRFESLNRLGNPSGTGRTGSIVAGALTAAADPLTFLGTSLGINVVARILARPATARSAAVWARAYEAVSKSKTPANVAAFENASRRLMGMLDDDSEIEPRSKPQRFAALDAMATQEEHDDSLAYQSSILKSIDKLNPDYHPGPRESTNVIDKRGEGWPAMSIGELAKVLLHNGGPQKPREHHSSRQPRAKDGKFNGAPVERPSLMSLGERALRN